MKPLGKKDAVIRMKRDFRLLIATHETSGTVYSLDNGAPVAKRAAEALTGQMDMFQSCPVKMPPQSAALIANEDGLFPGFSQTWRAQ